MQIIKIKQSNFVERIRKNISCANHETGYCLIESPAVSVYKEKYADTKTCEALGYTIYEAAYNGGIIVINEGDIAMFHFGPIENNWMLSFASYFVDWLEAKGLDAKFTGNDILVDGYKVCGLCVTRYGRVDYALVFIGINTKLEDIKQICTKPMVKVPKGLSEYGITTEEVEQMFLDFCAQQDN